MYERVRLFKFISSLCVCVYAFVCAVFVCMIELQKQYEGKKNNCQEVRIKIRHITERGHFHSAS